MIRTLSRAAAAAIFLAASNPAAADGPRVLAIVTSPEIQVQGMAFVLLKQMRQEGATVEVMLCGTAAETARRTPPDSVRLRPMNATPAQMLQDLVRAGVRTEVCALYLINAGLPPDALIEGVAAATPVDVARRMLDPRIRVLPF